jgi:cupin 2 domain-containing protein
VTDRWLRGRLGDAAGAPASGEQVDRLAALGDVVVEQIRSGELAAPVDYVQDADEWVVLLSGRATLVVAGETVELGPGEWLFLPARVHHRLVETQPGSSWLAVTTTRSGSCPPRALGR